MSNSKMREQFEKIMLSKFHPTVLEMYDGRYVRGVVADEFQRFCEGWQAALSSQASLSRSEPVQVSRPALEIPIFYGRSEHQSIVEMVIKHDAQRLKKYLVSLECLPSEPEVSQEKAHQLTVFASPPDYKDLQWKYEGALESIRDHAKLDHVLLAENEALRQRVAELESQLLQK